jgi:hypothetical protein
MDRLGKRKPPRHQVRPSITEITSGGKDAWEKSFMMVATKGNGYQHTLAAGVQSAACRSFMCLSLGHILHNFSGIEWFLGGEQIAGHRSDPRERASLTCALEGGTLVKIAVVELRQVRKLRLVEHRHAPPVDIDDPIVAQLPDDAVGMHRRDAECLR